MSDTDVSTNVNLTATDQSEDVFRGFAQHFNDTITAAQNASKGLTTSIDSLGKSIDVLGKNTKQQGEQIAVGFDNAGDAVSRYFSRFLSIGIIEEFARRSVMNFSEVERGMERIGFETRASQQQLSSLGTEFDDLAKLSGMSIAQIEGEFSKFQATSGLAFEPAKQQFKLIVEAAEATGASVDSLGRIAIAASKNLNVSGEEMKTLFNNLAVTMPGPMFDAFASMAPRLTQTLEQMNISGRHGMEQLAIIFQAVEPAIGSPLLAARQLNDLMTQMTDPFTKFGALMFGQLEQIRQAGGGTIEQMDAAIATATRLGAFSDDVLTKFNFQHAYGLDANAIRMLAEVRNQTEAIHKEAIATGESVDVIGKRNAQLAKDNQD